MLKSEDIANVGFRKAGFGGYNVDDVDQFIDQVQAAFDQMQKEKNELSQKIEELTQKVDAYRMDEESIQTTLLSAQKLADASIREAKHKAEVILKDASSKAEKIIAGAHNDVVDQQRMFEKLQADVASFRTRLMAIYREHLTLINALPAEPSVEEKKQPDKTPEEKTVVPPISPESNPISADPTEIHTNSAPEDGGFTVKQPEETTEPALSQSDKFRSLKFGENYDISKDEEDSPIGLFKRGNK